MTIYLMNAIPVAKFVPDAEMMALIIQRCTLDEVKYALNKVDFVSAVGHAATADVISTQFEVELRADDLIYAALVTIPRRLADGERLSEEELLTCPVTWVAAEIDFWQ